MEKLILSEENIKQLDAFIQEMPTKFGFPLLQFLQKISQEQKILEEQKPKDEKP
jgi:hypothetical protein